MGLKRPVALIALVLPAIVACNEDNTLGLSDSGRTSSFTATMTGRNVRPVPVATTTVATAQLSIRQPNVGEVGRQLTFAIVATNLTSALSAHIHLGGAAISGGPILVTLYTNPTDSVLTSQTLVTGVIPEGLLGFSLDSLSTLMSIGAAYVDIHATGNLVGLVRGQLSKKGEEPPLDLFSAPSLTGAKERPTPVVTTATGSATFELLSNSTIRYKVDVAGITGATMAHIHTAVADSAGPIAVTLFTASTPTGQLTGTLASGTFSATNIQLPGISFDSLLALMRSGRTYVNVHTDAHPNGEIRAQIDPVTVLPK